MNRPDHDGSENATFGCDMTCDHAMITIIFFNFTGWEVPEIPGTSPVFAGTFGTLIIMGILMNIILTVSILSIKRLRITQNFFVLNMSVADILLGVNGVLSFVEMLDITPMWMLKPGACKFFGMLSLIPAIVVILSMVVIARNRFLAVTIVAKQSSRYTIKFVLSTLGIIWLASTMMTLPIAFEWVTIETGLFCMCCFYFKDNMEYGISISVGLYFLPNILIAYYYIRILVHVRRSRRRVQQHQMAPLCQARSKQELRLATQFIVLFVAFNMFYLPSMVIFWIESEDNDIPQAVQNFGMIIFGLNITSTPILYFGFNRMARNEAARIFRRCHYRTCRKRRNSRVSPRKPVPGDVIERRTTTSSVTSEGEASSRSDSEVRKISITVQPLPQPGQPPTPATDGPTTVQPE